MKWLCAILILFFFSVIASAQQEPAKLIGATLLGEQAFDVYQTQDATVYKKRTPKSKDPEDPPAFENLLNRQKMFEIGMSVGSLDARGLEGRGGISIFSNVHFPNPKLARLNAGVEITNHGNSYGYNVGMPAGNFNQNWKVLGEYDYLVIPYGFGGMAFSAGYAYGKYNLQKFDSAKDAVVSDGTSHEHFLSLRYRWLLEQNFANQTNKDSSVSHSVVFAYKVSNKKSQEFVIGYALGFGKKASPRVEKQK